tara:strand:+ start:12609 stop:12872 length:264 start_codon:yes stop_codon:yes gene_type:complete
MNEKKKKKPVKIKNLSDVYKDTTALISSGLNQMGIKYEKDEPWGDLAKKCGKDLKLKASIEESAALFKRYEFEQTFTVVVGGDVLGG